MNFSFLRGVEVKNQSIISIPKRDDRHKKKNIHNCKINTFLTSKIMFFYHAVTNSEISDSDTNSEDGDLEDTTDEQVSKFCYGKNRYKWSQKLFQSRNSRTLQHNIVVNLPGLRNSYRNNSNITSLQAWSYFIDDGILFEILTNIQISKHREKYKNINSNYLRNIDIIEPTSFYWLIILFRCVQIKP
jgi:hypothetical protein